MQTHSAEPKSQKKAQHKAAKAKIQYHLTALFEKEQAVPERLAALVEFLRQGGVAHAAERMDELIADLQQNTEHAQALGEQLHGQLVGLNLYPALVNLGIFARRALLREMATRLYDRLIPPPREEGSSLDLLAQLFHRKRDAEWLATIQPVQWLRLYAVLARASSEESVQAAEVHLRQEILYVLEMLAIWIAAEELEPELMRIDKKLIDIDSPFIALQREMQSFTQHEARRMEGADLPPFDAGHLWVMLEQSQEQVDRIRRRGRGAAGSSLAVAHLLERLEQTIARMSSLLSLLTTESSLLVMKRSVALWQHLVLATTVKNSIVDVWRTSTAMLSRSVTQNKSVHGEHYIARDAKSYFTIMRSAAGAGFVIAFMALLKIYIESQGFAPLANTVLVSLNYGLGFVLIHLLRCTIATKQPAMTAASFAAEVERGDNGRAISRKLAVLLVDVNRSQWAAVWGNISTALLTAAVVCFGVYWWLGSSLLDAEAVSYQLLAIEPISGLALFYAAIAGVWLFCSGLIAGYFDNRADYVQLRERLFQHILLRWLGEERRERFANYLHENYGAIMGNFFFGVLLGVTGYIGYLTGLPLDIRHVAFSSANLGFASFSDFTGLYNFVVGLLFVLMIGFVNLWVSFTLALLVAMQARGTSIQRFRPLFRCLGQQLREKPLSFFFPIAPEKMPEKPADKRGSEH
ncbi:site-specific recombinase [Idiomarina sp. A28L]|uniref:site-specific recombinase n=1 Tax=Idiomarina sp. A28L TaxID=1036674 RepID=UPI0002138C36|nr:site-specific recombinase [Idiomarina sp. A28L]EGN74587.1 site-specific recombinase [Idiomarina sp. A28L]